METKKRDITLDYLRGFAMLQVVLVHLLYWLVFFPTGIPGIVRSFTLFEMPVLFFVTGAVNSMAKKGPYASFCVKRIKAILLPYYTYAVICILMAVIYFACRHELSPGMLLKMTASWLVPLDRQIMPLYYFTWAVWFVPVYCICIALFPLIKSAFHQYGAKVLIVLIVVFVAVEIICSVINGSRNPEVPSGFLDKALYNLQKEVIDLLQKTSFYIIFMGLGILYPSMKVPNKRNTMISSAVLATSLTGILLFMWLAGNTLDMQKNKFPPNHMFLLYSFAVLCAIVLLKPVVKPCYLRIVKAFPALDSFVLFFSRHSMYVFLYQAFAFSLLDLVLKKTGAPHNAWTFIILLVAVYPLVWLIVKAVTGLKEFIHSKTAKYV